LHAAFTSVHSCMLQARGTHACGAAGSAAPALPPGLQPEARVGLHQSQSLQAVYAERRRRRGVHAAQTAGPQRTQHVYIRDAKCCVSLAAHLLRLHAPQPHWHACLPLHIEASFVHTPLVMAAMAACTCAPSVPRCMHALQAPPLVQACVCCWRSHSTLHVSAGSAHSELRWLM
jgi:hypothetical protein